MGASGRLVLWSDAWVLLVGWCVEWCMGASGRLVCGVVHGCFRYVGWCCGVMHGCFG